MIEATSKDREEVVTILTAAFYANKSVNFIIRQDAQKEVRIRRLMRYSFRFCLCFGKVYLSPDGKGCALLLYPEKKQFTWKTFAWNLQLVLFCTGLANLKKAMERERKVAAQQCKNCRVYLWFIGVRPEAQHRGTGTALLQAVVREAATAGKTVCLETSAEQNLLWYQNSGFRLYDQLNLGYSLYFFKKEPDAGP